ncbi:bifunctional UDP-N-acetylglucosamine diphosphorylase/glucosamine-1-phosphate N-acetyltransferase GlmU [Geitlerinema sp. PCC 9228]|uniref:bifunctional UDP-N-acetylglucosamine diphosphorylase/glucosamine-1-phosphate N-acetyltransferase GlmU n=1 Tax=Geitlerinema sp. PCC 9228 TaxID=111611 RepID=UPI0008F9D4DF|nr:bifunctional UDP-N-acetylglucosamine diphosphorylase/glucosamine-1-phosphate N-acetyltransferase GlmU [Geitlerinema sp. PCC 9228]
MVAVAILAAGRGTRMKSDLPKVLHPLGGRSLAERVLHSISDIEVSRCFAIVGYQAEKVKQALQHFPNLEFIEQKEQLGTGHAVQQILPYLQGFEGDLLVLNGDVPLLRGDTLKTLLATHKSQGNAATILTAQLLNPKGYGRVFCDGNNQLKEIVEDRDCTAAQKQNRRINAGVYCFHWPDLAEFLPKLQADNEQQEYYLTDAVKTLKPAMAVDVEDPEEIMGINNRKQLAEAYSILQDRVKDAWMEAGVTLIDPDSITIDDTVALEPDVQIEPQTHLRGHTVVRSGSRLGPGSFVENSKLGKNVVVSYSVVTDSQVADNARIGPYAHLRGQVQVGCNCRVGNFVEMKKAAIGDDTNVAHLSYIGDATVGEQVNVGAGTITANYDGVAKHHTQIGDRSKTGSNSVLVAPVTIGEDVTIAAGSVITDDVDNDTLAIARSRQVNKPGWRRQDPSPNT